MKRDFTLLGYILDSITYSKDNRIKHPRIFWTSDFKSLYFSIDRSKVMEQDFQFNFELAKHEGLVFHSDGFGWQLTMKGFDFLEKLKQSVFK